MLLGQIGFGCEKTIDPPENPLDTLSTVLPDTIWPVANYTYIADFLTVTFTNTSIDAKTSRWAFNDGNYNSTDQDPVHTFPRTGTYTVSLVVRSEDKQYDTIVKDVEVQREALVTNPNYSLDNPYKNHSNWYRGQMHMHTNMYIDSVLFGSNDAEDPPDVMVETYRDLGYDFVSITDHWVYTIDPQVEGVLFISGEEVEAGLDGKGVHANAFNIDDTIPNNTLVEDLIEIENSFTQLNHPTRSSVMYHHLDNSGQDLWSIEIANWYNKKPKDLQLWDYMISQGKRIWGNAGDDMHDAGGAGHNATMVNSETLSKDDIISNLLVGNFYATEGGPDFVHMEISVDDKTITCSTTNGSRILWYKEDLQLIKTTEGSEGSYTPVGNEIFIRVEIQSDDDDDRDGLPNTAYSQPIFLNYL